MRIVIFASSKFSIPLLEKLHKSEHEICAVYSQPPSISGRGMKLKENEVCLKSRELNLKLLFPSITVYFVDRSDFIDANPGSFDARGSDGSGVDLGKSRFISYLGA